MQAVAACAAAAAGSKAPVRPTDSKDDCSAYEPGSS